MRWVQGRPSLLSSAPPPPQAEQPQAPPRRGPRRLLGEGARLLLLRLRLLLICNLKMHSKGTSLIVSTLIRQSAGWAPRGTLGVDAGGGAAMQEETQHSDSPGLGTHWLGQGCQRWLGLAVRGGVGGGADQDLGDRTSFQRGEAGLAETHPPQCPVERDRVTARAASRLSPLASGKY